MVRVLRALCLMAAGGWLVMLVGCNGTESKPMGNGGGSAFCVKEVRLQRSFTRILGAGAKAGDTGGIDAYVELLDQFGDPIKAVGEFRFEIFRYQPAVADRRGTRFEEEGMQEVDLRDLGVNQQYWDDITQCYRMRLKLPEEAAALRQIVLQVTFMAEGADRIQNMLVLER